MTQSDFDTLRVLPDRLKISLILHYDRWKMVRAISVFVRNTEVLVKTFRTYESVHPECPRSHRGYLFGFPVIAPIYESILSETHQQAIEVARRMAKEKGFELKVYNLSSKVGKLKAFLKGVKRTPTIIIDNHKVTDKISEEELSGLL